MLPSREDAQAAMRAAFGYKDTLWGLSTWPHVVDCYNKQEYSCCVIFAWFICDQALKHSG